VVVAVVVAAVGAVDKIIVATIGIACGKLVHCVIIIPSNDLFYDLFFDPFFDSFAFCYFLYDDLWMPVLDRRSIRNCDPCLITKIGSNLSALEICLTLAYLLTSVFSAISEI
jgi:hypothetical protein